MIESKGGSLDPEALQQVRKQVSKFWPPLQEFSAVLLQWRSQFWKLAWEPIAARFWSKKRTQLENAVSKIGFMSRDLKNHLKSVKTFRVKTEESWCLKNEHSCFLRLSLFVEPNMNPLYLQKKIKCSRAAGRYGGGTARRGGAWTFNFFKKLYLGLLVGYTVLDLLWALNKN